MNKKLFGTDGIRCNVKNEIFNNFSLNKLSKAIVRNKKNFKVVIGWDTRESSNPIQKKLVKQLKNNGAHLFIAGVVPTPLISFLTKQIGCDIGIVISASHNPYHYNGIKFFNRKGEKISEKFEKQIEKNFFNLNKSKKKFFVNGSSKTIKNPLQIYKKKLFSKLKLNNFPKKLKIVFDCANGSTYKIIKKVIPKTKINSIYLNNNPDGRNINHFCGSLYPKNLTKELKKHKADFGVSFDGDGDRIICSDEKGKIIDGDKILACLVKYFSSITNNKIKGTVGTHMTNAGLEKFIKKIGLKFYRANVGDKFVYNEMKKKNFIIGGEQSGHIILRDFWPSGDGVLIALCLIKIISDHNLKTSEIFDLYKPYLQTQKNIKIKDSKLLKNIRIKKLIKLYKNKYIDKNRVLIRLSGTEPLIRILVEGNNLSIINNLSKKLEKKIKNLL